MYEDSDAQFSFGAIDNLEAEANFLEERWMSGSRIPMNGIRYIAKYTKPKRCPDIGTPGAKRDTHFGHAALVQMKNKGREGFSDERQSLIPDKIFPGL
jgi:hypothetical protein